MEAKTVQNVINDLRTQYQLIVSVSFACQLINNAVNELLALYDSAYGSVELEVTGVVADVPQILSTMGVIKVTSKGVYYNRYTADANTITFKDNGDYKITALMIPDNVASTQDEIPVHIAYHPCVVMYAANHVNPENPKSDDKFYLYSKDINNRLSGIKRRGRYIPARVWR